MTKPFPNFLRLHADPRVEASPLPAAMTELADLCRHFEQCSGWPLRYVDKPAAGLGEDLIWSAPLEGLPHGAAGHLRIELGGAGVSRAQADSHDAAELADDLVRLLNELIRTQDSLWRREAELAAGVPLTPRQDEEEHLAERLEAILKAGATAVGCQAAGLYMLDAATGELKLRSLWGLSRGRLTDPARSLGEATADLEAMSGHAVVLEDAGSSEMWNPPEPFPSSMCLPVSSPTQIFGTLWVYSTTPRSFADEQTHIVETVAGRVAAELERAMLLSEGQQSARINAQLNAAEQQQREQLPTLAPLSETWDVAGWARQGASLGGAWFDWFVLDNQRIGLVAGAAHGDGAAAAMNAAALRAAVRAHAESGAGAAEVLTRANRTISRGSPGDQLASLCYAEAEPASGQVCCAAAGDVAIWKAAGEEPITQRQAALGQDGETQYQQQTLTLQPEDVLFLTAHLQETPTPGSDETPQNAAAWARLFATRAAGQDRWADEAALVIRRKR